jgi:single-strand DNA-binding protein
MASVNKTILIGNLGQKPELKYTPSGKAVCNFSIATNEKWTDKNDVKQERVEWHRIVVWGKTAENCAQFLDKGRACYIEGRLQTRSWEDKKRPGEKRYTTEIVATSVVFLGGGQKGERAGDGAPDLGDTDAPPPHGANEGSAGPPPGDDDIPF